MHQYYKYTRVKTRLLDLVCFDQPVSRMFVFSGPAEVSKSVPKERLAWDQP